MADAACAKDVVPATDDEIWEDVTLRFTPGAPQAWPGGLQRAGVSSSRQPDDGGFPGNWCIGLKRPEVPWETVDRTAAKFDDWRKFFRVGAQVQNLLRQASELHSNQAVPLFRVCLLITSFLTLFSVPACVLSESVHPSYLGIGCETMQGKSSPTLSTCTPRWRSCSGRMSTWA